MKAKLKNKTSKEYLDKLVKLEGYFEFEFAYRINEDYYEPIDKNFPSSKPIKESDLEFEK